MLSTIRWQAASTFSAGQKGTKFAQRRSMATTTVNGTRASIQLYDLQPEPGVCPYVQRAKIVLKEKGLPFETTYIDAKNKDKDFLHLFRSITANPGHRGTVPVIVDGNVKLAESLVVSEYLDLQYPETGPKLFPTDPYKLALVRLFVDSYATQVQPAGAKVIAAVSLQEYKEGLQAFKTSLKVIDTFLATHGDKSGDFLLGKDFSFAEAGTLPFYGRIYQTLPHVRGISVNDIILEGKLDHLKKWSEAGLEKDSVLSTFPPNEILIAKSKERVKVATEDLK